VLRLNEQDMTATVILNVDLGGFSFALGAAQVLANGNYYFGGGWYIDNSAKAIVVDTSGNTLYTLQTFGPEFLSFHAI
jgi:hypothetical protein